MQVRLRRFSKSYQSAINLIKGFVDKLGSLFVGEYYTILRIVRKMYVLVVCVSGIFVVCEIAATS